MANPIIQSGTSGSLNRISCPLLLLLRPFPGKIVTRDCKKTIGGQIVDTNIIISKETSKDELVVYQSFDYETEIAVRNTLLAD